MPMVEEGRDVEHNIVSEDTRKAHRYLLEIMPRLGLTPSLNSGHVRAVRLHDVENRYLFSWIPGQRHLLFYIRKPARSAAPHLQQSIVQTSLRTAKNPAGEITVRVEREEDARMLADWLASELPLSV
jgi:hypothetical protein